ncbi:MAG: xylulokinase [Candidatus Atribacteria bacterium]|nr:xylulokinase [Candidatus Atribacteria bacterium]
MNTFLGIDVGTTGCKAVLVNEEGELIAKGIEEYPLYTPRPNWAEQDPADWVRGTFQAIKKTLDSAGVDRKSIAGIGLTGQMHGSVFLDQKGEVIRPAILWCDQRTAKECEEITRIVGQENMMRINGNPVLAGFTAPKIYWLKNNEPDHYARVAKVLLPKDYIRFCLTGDFATDVSDASGTSLFDVPHRKWSEEIISALDLKMDWFPRCYESPEITGYLKKDLAGQLGMSEKVIVVAGGGDNAAGAIGTGIVKSGLVSASIGTSGVVFAFSDEVKIDMKGRVHTFCHAVPGKWHVMGVMLAAGGSFRWFRDVLGMDEKNLSTLLEKDAYELLTQEAEKVEPGGEGLIFLPYLTGERTPHADPYARGVFFGLTLKHRKNEMVRSVMEGVTFGMRDSLEIIREMNIPIREVMAIGGGAKSSLWRSIQADIYQVPLYQVKVDEGPAFGAALLAAVGKGVFKTVPQACEKAVRVLDKILPDPDQNARYNEIYGIYRDLYPALKPFYKRVANIR